MPRVRTEAFYYVEGYQITACSGSYLITLNITRRSIPLPADNDDQPPSLGNYQSSSLPGYAVVPAGSVGSGFPFPRTHTPGNQPAAAKGVKFSYWKLF